MHMAYNTYILDWISVHRYACVFTRMWKNRKMFSFKYDLCFTFLLLFTFFPTFWSFYSIYGHIRVERKIQNLKTLNMFSVKYSESSSVIKIFFLCYIFQVKFTEKFYWLYRCSKFVKEIKISSHKNGKSYPHEIFH